MSGSAADILSITTSRETLFVGPLSAFPVQARRSLLRDRTAIRDALHLFLSRPGAEETIRPYLRHWHFDTTAVRSAHRAGLADMLVLAAVRGTLAIAVAPEVTLAVARLGEDLDARLPPAGAQPFTGNVLPDDFIDRLFLVAEMIPDKMQGAARQEFQALIEGGYEMLIISLVAMLIPGVNVAILGMSLFTLPGQILEALDRLVEVVESIRDAKSERDLELAAAAGAVVLVILIREGIMRRFMSAQFVRKGIAALKSKVRKPAPVKTPVRHVAVANMPIESSPGIDKLPVGKGVVARYQRPDAASLSDMEARQWYLAQEANIPTIVDQTKPLKTQAQQAFVFRNEIRTAARDAMKNRAEADRLMKEEPNLTWDDIVKIKEHKGFSPDDVYKEILKSSQKSRDTVNKKLGL